MKIKQSSANTSPHHKTSILKLF